MSLFHALLGVAVLFGRLLLQRRFHRHHLHPRLANNDLSYLLVLLYFDYLLILIRNGCLPQHHFLHGFEQRLLLRLSSVVLSGLLADDLLIRFRLQLLVFFLLELLLLEFVPGCFLPLELLLLLPLLLFLHVFVALVMPELVVCLLLRLAHLSVLHLELLLLGFHFPV